MGGRWLSQPWKEDYPSCFVVRIDNGGSGPSSEVILSGLSGQPSPSYNGPHEWCGGWAANKMFHQFERSELFLVFPS